MSGFRVIPHPGPPGSAEFVVYDLEYDTAQEWHQYACKGDTCWCQDLAPNDFLKRLHEKVLKRAKYALVSTPPGTAPKSSIRLMFGPGFITRDDTQLKDTIRSN